MSQPHNNRSKFNSTLLTLNSLTLPPSNNDFNAVIGLMDNLSSTFDNKLAKTLALYIRWQYKDIKEQTLKKKTLQTCQQTQYKELSRIFFSFTLHNTQTDAIYTLFYEKINLLLFVKMGFSKSLIFQLLFFMIATPSIVLILMSLKLLQIEQSKLINQIPQSKEIVLNRKNNMWNVLAGIANRGYTHVFTSSEIALSKKFKNNILNQSFFTNCLCLLVIDEIHLIEEQNKNFQSMYTKIEKVQK